MILSSLPGVAGIEKRDDSVPAWKVDSTGVPAPRPAWARCHRCASAEPWPNPISAWAAGRGLSPKERRDVRHTRGGVAADLSQRRHTPEARLEEGAAVVVGDLLRPAGVADDQHERRGREHRARKTG